MKTLRVTLEQPFVKDSVMKENPMILSYGFKPAKVIGGGNVIRVGSESYSDDDMVDAGSHSDVVPRSQRTIIPGEKISWEFLCSDKDKNGFLLPAAAVRLYFGNWLAVRENTHGVEYDQTFNYERNRVALQWGWWKMPQRTTSGYTHLRQGQDPPDTTKIGPPNVPHVLIESIDNRGKADGVVKFRPWDFFRWQDDVVAQDLPADVRHSSSVPLVETYTPDQLRAIANELEARAKTAQKA